MAENCTGKSLMTFLTCSHGHDGCSRGTHMNMQITSKNVKLVLQEGTRCSNYVFITTWVFLPKVSLLRLRTLMLSM